MSRDNSPASRELIIYVLQLTHSIPSAKYRQSSLSMISKIKNFVKRYQPECLIDDFESILIITQFYSALHSVISS